MSALVEELRAHLEAGELGAFLEKLETYRSQARLEPEVTGLTQRLLPPLLRTALRQGQLSPDEVVRLYKLVRSGQLLLVENDLLVSINARINEAMRQLKLDAEVPVTPLVTLEKERTSRVRWSPAATASSLASATQVERVALVSAFTVSTWSKVDAFDFRKNVCASRQELEFLRAIRQYFPSLRAYPNMPLKAFIDLDNPRLKVPARARSYGWAAQVDVLLCTEDEDPVAGIELDSVHHDTEEAAERDKMKQDLFRLAGLPLVRIRPDNERAVRAEDFYEFLRAESRALDELRPRSLRARRSHDTLVPAESASRTTIVGQSLGS
jgi:hypothetical protein